MNVKIAMLVAASEYERLTLDTARSSSMPAPKCTEAQAMDCRERAVSVVWWICGGRARGLGLPSPRDLVRL